MGEGFWRADGTFRKTCIRRDSSDLCLLLWGRVAFILSIIYWLGHARSWWRPVRSLVVACGNLAPWLGTEPGSPALGVQRLSHWTTREVPKEEMLLIGHYQILQGLIPHSGQLWSLWVKGAHCAFPMGLWVGAGSGVCSLSRDRPTQSARKWRSKEIY